MYWFCLKLMCLCVLLSFGAAGKRSHAASILSPAGLGAPLNNTGGSARAMAMGSAFVAVADDSSAMFWNPAGLAELKVPELALHHNTWMVDTLQETVIVVMPFPGQGVMGYSVSYVDWGSFEKRDGSGILTGSFNDRDLEVSMGWGGVISFEGPLAWAKSISTGLSLRGLRQHLASSSDIAFSGDLGFLWNSPFPGLRCGLAYSHLGTPISGSFQASGLRVGLSYSDFRFDRNNRLLLSASSSLEPQGINRIQLGAENFIYSVLGLRIGYLLNLADTQLQGLTGLTAGVGFKLQKYLIDYAYLPFGDLGTSHRVSLSYQFENKHEAELDSSNGLRLKKELSQAGLESQLLAGNVLRVNLSSDILRFNIGRSTLAPEDESRLTTLAEILNKYPESRILIEGHTDNTGTPQDNQILSLQRAEAVKNNLLFKRVPKACIIGASGYGGSQPVAGNGTEAGKAMNRRVILKINFGVKLQ